MTLPSIDPVFSLLLGLGFAFLFARAGVHKLGNRAETRRIIVDYGILPHRLVSKASWFVPAFEMLIAAGLVAEATRVIAALGGAALLLLYGAAIWTNLARGRRDLECGCAFGGRTQTISLALVYRNIFLAAVLLLGALPVSGREVGGMDFFTITAGFLAASLLYGVANTLIDNQSKQVSK